MKRSINTKTRSFAKQKKEEEEERSREIINDMLHRSKNKKNPSSNGSGKSNSFILPPTYCIPNESQKPASEVSQPITSSVPPTDVLPTSSSSHANANYIYPSDPSDMNFQSSPFLNSPQPFPFRTEALLYYQRNVKHESMSSPHPPYFNNVTPLSDSLHTCISNGSFDLYKAGRAVHSSYSRGDLNTSSECESFARKHAHLVKTFSLPPLQHFSDPNYFSVMLHGHIIFNLLKSHSPQLPVTMQKSGETEFKSLVGAIYRTRHLDMKYPEENPFSGEKIYLIDKPISNGRKLEESHVVPKRLIFQLLERSCKVPSDIKSNNWNLPYESSYSNHSFFPENLYLDMRTFFLHYFGIEEEELDNGMWNDSFINLKCLASWESISSKKKRYANLCATRAEFMSKDGFHSALREALKEIKRASYSPPPPGVSFGTWTLRKRNKNRASPLLQTHS